MLLRNPDQYSQTMTEVMGWCLVVILKILRGLGTYKMCYSNYSNLSKTTPSMFGAWK